MWRSKLECECESLLLLPIHPDHHHHYFPHPMPSLLPRHAISLPPLLPGLLRPHQRLSHPLFVEDTQIRPNCDDGIESHRLHVVWNLGHH